MKIEYSADRNIAYIRLRERADDLVTREITETVFVDIDTEGHVVGLEMLNPSPELWQQITIDDEDTGQLIKLSRESGASAEDHP